jgi:hypothetical protein
MSSIPTAAGISQYAIGGSWFRTGKFLPIVDVEGGQE